MNFSARYFFLKSSLIITWTGFLSFSFFFKALIRLSIIFIWRIGTVLLVKSKSSSLGGINLNSFSSYSINFLLILFKTSSGLSLKGRSSSKSLSSKFDLSHFVISLLSSFKFSAILPLKSGSSFALSRSSGGTFLGWSEGQIFFFSINMISWSNATSTSKSDDKKLTEEIPKGKSIEDRAISLALPTTIELLFRTMIWQPYFKWRKVISWPNLHLIGS